jgi:ribose transport system ATP-binding protein
MALLSEDRKREGLLLNRSIAENLLITRPEPISRGGFLRLRAEQHMALDWMERLDVRAQGAQQPVGELSGGNQQKVAFGRLLYHQARLLLLDEPTRGIDVGSKASIYRRIGRAAEQGKTVVLVSSYIPELLGVCDTIAVCCRGEVVAVKPAAEWNEHALISAAIGQSAEGEATGADEREL